MSPDRTLHLQMPDENLASIGKLTNLMARGSDEVHAEALTLMRKAATGKFHAAEREATDRLWETYAA